MTNKNIAIVGKGALAIATRYALEDQLVCSLPQWSDRLVNDPQIKTVIDLRAGGAGCYEGAMRLLSSAKNVITNNATLMASHGTPLRSATEAYQKHLLYSACLAEYAHLENYLTPQTQSVWLSGTPEINLTLNKLTQSSESFATVYTETQADLDTLHYQQKALNYQLLLLQQKLWPQAKPQQTPTTDLTALHSGSFGVLADLGYTPTYVGYVSATQNYTGVAALPNSHPLAQPQFTGAITTDHQHTQQLCLQQVIDPINAQLNAIMHDVQHIQRNRFVNLEANTATTEIGNMFNSWLLVMPQEAELPKAIHLHSVPLGNFGQWNAYRLQGQRPSVLPTPSLCLPLVLQTAQRAEQLKHYKQG